jgi:hypothetical protein
MDQWRIGRAEGWERQSGQKTANEAAGGRSFRPDLHRLEDFLVKNVKKLALKIPEVNNQIIRGTQRVCSESLYFYEKSMKLDSRTAKIAKSKTQNVLSIAPIFKPGFFLPENDTQNQSWVKIYSLWDYHLSSRIHRSLTGG